MFGIFEMVDSTGFPIIAQCLTNLPDQLHAALFKPLLLQITDFIRQGKTEEGERVFFLLKIG